MSSLERQPPSEGSKPTALPFRDNLKIVEPPTALTGANEIAPGAQMHSVHEPSTDKPTTAGWDVELQKKVLFIRHKLQRGFLNRDEEPKAEHMETLAKYISSLEGLPDLEPRVIRLVKIDKVLKAILKLEDIPKEDEFHFRGRCERLLEKYHETLDAVARGPRVVDPLIFDDHEYLLGSWVFVEKEGNNNEQSP